MIPRVLSGVQPSGNLHIGNYLGALSNWVRIQHDYESIFCIVDLHAITVFQKPDELRASIRDLAALFLAAGIDPKHSRIVVQSSVPAHAELAWLLTCVTPMGWLERMTQFKAKAALQESIGDGIFQYPVLMAADILDDPTTKMSKSVVGGGHAVALLDPPERIRKTIMRATTDSATGVDFETMGPGVANLLNIFQAFGEWGNDQMQAHFTGMRYGDLKKQVAEMVVTKLEPLQARYREITSDPGYLDGVLRAGAEAVTPVANSTVQLVKERMGLYV